MVDDVVEVTAVDDSVPSRTSKFLIAQRERNMVAAIVEHVCLLSELNYISL